MKTIGIPRGLFFYYYYPLWRTFFEKLGVQVVVSAPTNRRIVDQGLLTAVNEACLPVKVYYGHVLDLCHRGVDYIFAPRLVSVEYRGYICPKFMGIPDMLRAQIPDLPPLIDIKVDLSRDERQLERDVFELGKLFGSDRYKVKAAWAAGQQELEEFRRIAAVGFPLNQAVTIWERAGEAPMASGDKTRLNPGGENIRTGGEASEATPRSSDLTIGVLGHGYSLCDAMVSMGLVRKLQELGARVVTAEMLKTDEVEAYASTLPKRMFWTLGKKNIGSALWMDEEPAVDGIIYLACFGCGPDSLVGEIIARRVVNTPFMMMIVDEHTGEAGVVTRLEAFYDMVARRKNAV
ncbi:MAG: hypothetical protein GX964_04590 [Syntrophomonadaceae bacterium]|jgi:predicted nucleotide-binding protein (sugar kinase/HSP70/actin superfamily)|nr:hypothetical protein [Syntrophomonadaceae bacterium]